jgi:hypothetical protein
MRQWLLILDSWSLILDSLRWLSSPAASSVPGSPLPLCRPLRPPTLPPPPPTHAPRRTLHVLWQIKPASAPRALRSRHHPSSCQHPSASSSRPCSRTARITGLGTALPPSPPPGAAAAAPVTAPALPLPPAAAAAAPVTPAPPPTAAVSAACPPAASPGGGRCCATWQSKWSWLAAMCTRSWVRPGGRAGHRGHDQSRRRSWNTPPGAALHSQRHSTVGSCCCCCDGGGDWRVWWLLLLLPPNPVRGGGQQPTTTRSCRRPSHSVAAPAALPGAMCSTRCWAEGPWLALLLAAALHSSGSAPTAWTGSNLSQAPCSRWSSGALGSAAGAAAACGTGRQACHSSCSAGRTPSSRSGVQAHVSCRAGGG